VVGGDTLPLARGAQVVEVTVRAGRDPEMQPALVQAGPGDVVRIVSSDGGPHALAFDLTSTDSASRAYLEGTGQLRGPPLLSAGATWILRFDEASASGYLIRCLTHEAVLRVSVESQLARSPGPQ
jgi:plastocyanin